MKIDVMNKEGMVLLSRSSGETLRVSIMEFWQICQAGARLDVKQEIDEYLSDNGECEGVDADVIRDNVAFLDEVVDQVLDIRASKENSGQIHDAISYCLKHGKHKDELHTEKSLADMDVADFKDPGRRQEFNGLLHAYRDLTRRMHEQNGMPFGGDRNMQDFLKLRLGDVMRSMDLLRLKEWLSQQPYDLDTRSAQYREAMDMMEEICGWSFPELAGMVFDNSDGDLVFREPSSTGEYAWYYYNSDSNAGGQIVGMPFDEDKAIKMLSHPEPISVIDGRKCWMEDVDKKGFFITIFDMLQMNKDGWFIGTDIQEVCKEISGQKQVDSLISNATGRAEEVSTRVDTREIALE